MPPAEIRIGTSGYSFADWVGPFYPEGIQKGKMLDFYAGHFETVEINSTYYRIPDKYVFYHLDKKTPGEFEFIAKLNKDTTHAAVRKVEAVDSLLAALTPLIDAGKLKGLLAQFPWGFKWNDRNIAYLTEVRNRCGAIPLFVEFRHASWDREEVYDSLRKEGIGYCCVDEPALPGLVGRQSISTTDTGYVRFHGRNELTWWNSAQGDRYDYLYNEKELEDWLERLRELRNRTTKTYIFFNNCHQGHAVKNAKMLIEMLSRLPDFRQVRPAILN